MVVIISIADGRGWETHRCEVPDGSDAECYALPKGASRAEFWSQKTGLKFEDGRALIWEVAR